MRFVNGMSANERYGALANWTRLGYENTQKQLAADYNLVTVINNRADRVPRSKVFARLIAYDFSVSKHFIIGNNLDGFCSLAMDAWLERLDIELNESLNKTEFVSRCRELTEFLVVPTTEISLVSYLQKVVGDKTQSISSFETFATEIAANEIEAIDSITSNHLTQVINDFKICQTFLSIEPDDMKIDKALLQQAKTAFVDMFKRKLVVVDDYFISGEALNLRIALQIPSGVKTDIIGLQNIKGPGLDFVYSWQQWQKVHGLLHSFAQGYGEGVKNSINELAALPSFSCLDRKAVENWIESLATNSRVTREDFTLQLDQISAAISKHSTVLDINDSGKPIWQPLLTVVEEFIDIFDAVIRGRLAKRILVDLAAQRISLNNAAWLLMQINKRQKGGWLTSRK